MTRRKDFRRGEIFSISIENRENRVGMILGGDGGVQRHDDCTIGSARGR